jgi:hypothetical protein
MNILHHAARRAAPLLAAACLLVAPILQAGDPVPTPTPTPIPTLKLNDGRVYHNVQVRKDQDDSLVVRADEGLLKIPKSSLPPDLASAYPVRQVQPANPDMVMQPFNPNGAQALPGQAPGQKILRPTPTPTRPKGVYKGCTIVSFEPKPFQTSLGCVEVVIRNDSEDPVTISPGEIICVTTSGVRRQGRLFVVDGDTPSIRRSETIPAHGDMREILTFTNEAIDISYVLWAR